MTTNWAVHKIDSISKAHLNSSRVSHSTHPPIAAVHEVLAHYLYYIDRYRGCSGNFNSPSHLQIMINALGKSGHDLPPPTPHPPPDQHVHVPLPSSTCAPTYTMSTKCSGPSGVLVDVAGSRSSRLLSTGSCTIPSEMGRHVKSACLDLVAEWRPSGWLRSDTRCF